MSETERWQHCNSYWWWYNIIHFCLSRSSRSMEEITADWWLTENLSSICMVPWWRVACCNNVSRVPSVWYNFWGHKGTKKSVSVCGYWWEQQSIYCIQMLYAVQRNSRLQLGTTSCTSAFIKWSHFIIQSMCGEWSGACNVSAFAWDDGACSMYV